MRQSYQPKIFIWLTLICVCSLNGLTACSQPRSSSQTPPQPPLLTPNPDATEALSDELFAKSVLNGSDRPGSSPLDLLQNAQVKAELDITEEQSAKLAQIKTKQQRSEKSLMNSDFGQLTSEQREQKLIEISEEIQAEEQAVREEVATVLKPNQLKRFKEITLQLYGWGLLTGKQFAEELQITPQQLQQLEDLHRRVLQEAGKSWLTSADSTSASQQTSKEVFRQNMDRLIRQSNQQALAILTPEQQKTLETLKGRKFELDYTQIPQTNPSP